MRAAPRPSVARTHTLDPDNTCPAPRPCFDEGVPTAWWRSKISYGLNQNGFPGVPDGQLRATLIASVAAWTEVSCDGQSVGLEVTQLPGTTALEKGPALAEPNENVIVHHDPASWASYDYSSFAYALTSVWFRSKTGEIIGADMELNGGYDTYGDCALTPCSAQSSVQTDLQNVTTHEFGHFFGLSHSPEPGSTMSCSASATDTDKRSIETDDIDGLCDIYPPGASFSRDPKEHEGRHCSLSAGQATQTPTSPLAVLGLLSALLVVRRRRTLSRS